MTRTAALPRRATIGALAIDAARRSATVAGEELYLSEAEFTLISALASEPGRLFSHAELEEICSPGIERIERCAERLARKLELRGMEGQLRCEPGVGLVLEATTAQLGGR